MYSSADVWLPFRSCECQVRPRRVSRLLVPLVLHLVVDKPYGGVFVGNSSNSLSKQVTSHTGELINVVEDSVEEERKLGKFTGFQLFNGLDLDNVELIHDAFVSSSRIININREV